MVAALGGAVFMLLLSNIDVVTRGDLSLPALVPPFGASVAIVFFSPQSPLARPWNVIMGHFSSALTACTFLWLFPDANRGLLCALAVSGAGLVMIATKSFHPPGGATA